LSGPLTVRLTRRAATHIEQATAWWTENRPLASGAMQEELEEAFALLRTQPHVGIRASSKRFEGVRRLHLSRVHYYLYYRVLPGRIDVLALWRTSRGTGPNL
jgi:plasmid stabilization system protein ParE